MLFVHPPQSVARRSVRLCLSHVKKIMRPEIGFDSIPGATTFAGMSLLSGCVRSASNIPKMLKPCCRRMADRGFRHTDQPGADDPPADR
jgi:hypothetical protein